MQRSLNLLRSEGWLVDIVERTVPRAHTKNDLFGFIDILAVRDEQTLAVQTTDITNVSHRVRKIREHDNVAAVRNAGWQIVVHGWRKDGRLRLVDLTAAV